MRNIPIVKTYRHPLLFLCEIAVYSLLLGVMAINSISFGSVYMAALLCALAVSLSMPLSGFCCAVFMTIPFTAVLKLPIEMFNYMTLMQLLLIVRCIVGSVKVRGTTMVTSSFACLLSQIIPVVIYGQTMSNILLLIFNVLTFYCVYKLAITNKISIPHIFLSFAVGVLVAGVVSMTYGISMFINNDYRFGGLWTDPNFWGMFCLIGIVTSLIIGFRNPVAFLILIPLILALAYQGFLTLSRTFVVVCALMVLVISWSYLKKSILGSIMVMCLLAVAVYFALPYVDMLFSERQVSEYDVSNGRFESTLDFLNYCYTHYESFLFGLGYNNSLNVNDVLHISNHATHNSYADLFVDFGIVNILLFIVGLIKKHTVIKCIFKNLTSGPGIVFCIIIFYMGTLSMLKYALLFLFSGLFIGDSVNNKKSLSKKCLSKVS